MHTDNDTLTTKNNRHTHHYSSFQDQINVDRTHLCINREAIKVGSGTTLIAFTTYSIKAIEIAMHAGTETNDK
jgi:hypothetical protein